MGNPEDYVGKKFYDQIIGGHRAWLGRFGGQHRGKWDDLFEKDNSEAALCEAATRQMLEELGVEVEPHDCGGNERRPDFKCSKNGEEFYVEATCITKESATNKSDLEDVPKDDHGGWYRLLTGAQFKKACDKTSQFAGLDAACLLAIGTWHFRAGALCFDGRAAKAVLTGTREISRKVDMRIGAAIGGTYETTGLKWAGFLAERKIISSEPPIVAVRQTISGVLLCPFGTQPTEILGVLHPQPNYPFKRYLFPDIKFCRLADGWTNGVFQVEWV